MATLQEISDAIQSIESKKQTLKNAFEDLQKQSSHLSSFSLTWPQIDSHFSQIQSSLLSRFSHLQQSIQDPDPQIPPNSDIRSICEKMEAPNLIIWVKENLNVKHEGLIEFAQALKHAPDPFKLVLDAIEGLDSKAPSVALLECLLTIEGVNACGEVKERARILALKWKQEMGGNTFEALGFLSVLGCYQLVEEFGRDDIVQCVHIAATNAKTIKLCRVLGLEEKVPDVIEKLVSEGKRLMAARYAFEFKPLDKYSPVELLKSYLDDAKKAARQIRNKGEDCPSSKDKADEREVNALRTVLRYIRDLKLESDYPPEALEKKIKGIENARSNRKRKPPSINPMNKKNASSIVGVNSKVPNAQPLVLSGGQLGLGSSTTSAYALSMPNAPVYVDPGNLLHGLASVYANNNNPSSSRSHSHVYVPGSQMPSSSCVPQPHQPYCPM